MLMVVLMMFCGEDENGDTDDYADADGGAGDGDCGGDAAMIAMTMIDG